MLLDADGLMDGSEQLLAKNLVDPNTTDPTHQSGSRSAASGSTASDSPLPRGFLLKRALIYGSLTIAGAVVDLWSKAAIFSWRGLPGERDAWWIVDGIFGIETALNPGAVFGIGAGKGLLFAAFSIAAAAGILVWLFRFGAARSLWLTWALGLITGGIIGNLYDRLSLWWQPGYPPEWKSCVRDWILFRIEGMPLLDPWPNFNIADSLLVIGAGMLIYQSLVLDPRQEAAESSDDAPA